ncbi:hypothetical protein [Methylomonas albis]|uniref:Uncharacterized protein n=1 Tax=Methylomonas albis TaxID=1854563 RepID=A0ABR9D160_9GAMM|nr:hypothetical protein [Methylomonas albis]MBD9356862.1 hypothetical protein [Methylomonas albis]
MINVNTVFTQAAEKCLSGESGIIKFNYSIYPNVGDTLTIRTSPNNIALTFVCISRHFDFSNSEKAEMTIELDVS